LRHDARGKAIGYLLISKDMLVSKDISHENQMAQYARS